MPQLGFQKQFATLVESGDKKQTIRAYRKDGKDPKVGDRLYLWTGPYDHSRRKIGESICLEVSPIRMRWPRGRERSYSFPIEIQGKRGGWRKLSIGEVVALAKADGFDRISSFRFYFASGYGLPFEGLLIRWGDIELAPNPAEENRSDD